LHRAGGPLAGHSGSTLFLAPCAIETRTRLQPENEHVNATTGNAGRQTHTPLFRALAEIREALRAPQRTQARVRRIVARFGEIAQLELQNEDCARWYESDSSSSRCIAHSDAWTMECVSLLEQVQALCILARSGIETHGWWRAVEGRCNDLESQLLGC
jgi:hypothetical protein